MSAAMTGAAPTLSVADAARRAAWLTYLQGRETAARAQLSTLEPPPGWKPSAAAGLYDCRDAAQALGRTHALWNRVCSHAATRHQLRHASPSWRWAGGVATDDEQQAAATTDLSHGPVAASVVAAGRRANGSAVGGGGASAGLSEEEGADPYEVGAMIGRRPVFVLGDSHSLDLWCAMSCWLLRAGEAAHHTVEAECFGGACEGDGAARSDGSGGTAADLSLIHI